MSWRVGLWCALALSLSSCAQHYRLTSTDQVRMLPASRGLNGGSFVAPSPWRYRGSKAHTHEFYYYYHDENVLKRCGVSIPREAVVLPFPERAFGVPREWVTLGKDSKTFQFDPSSKVHGGDD
ncbi:MAG: hypothetical protein ABJF10_30015 [Chthoniobacter sp.]|uniref:hypothetical protein n=1 Tax=Chthoniobacter sp. TaxID=2510640 RepID=UPI0032A80577